MNKRNKPPEPNYFEHGKIPPQALDLEEAVLGAMMLEANRANEVMQILTPESFYKDSHRIIYEAIIQLIRKNEPVDILTVRNNPSIAGTYK